MESDGEEEEFELADYRVEDSETSDEETNEKVGPWTADQADISWEKSFVHLVPNSENKRNLPGYREHLRWNLAALTRAEWDYVTLRDQAEMILRDLGELDPRRSEHSSGNKLEREDELRKWISV